MSRLGQRGFASMSALRYTAAAVLSWSASVAIWWLIINLDPKFMRLAPISLVPPLASGFIGGFVAAAIAPRRKIAIATTAGALLGIFLILIFRGAGYVRGAQNPWLWYWPLWLLPTYFVGGVLGKRMCTLID